MTTQFPTALDTFVNPVAGDLQSSVTVPHATQHANVNDAVAAAQAKIGENGSTNTATHDWKLSTVTASGTAASTLNFSGTSYGTNTGDQTITLTGSLSGSGTSTLSATINTGVVTEAKLGLSDVTTANVSTGAHGYAPKLPNDNTKFLDGTGSYSTPTAAAAPIAITGVVTGSGTSSITLTHVAPTGTGATVLQGTATLSGTTLVGGPVISGATIIGPTISGGTYVGASTFSGLIYSLATITVDTTLAGTHNRVLVDTTTGNVTATLPAAPTLGQHFVIKKIAAANTMTVARNGKNIEGAAADLSTTSKNFTYTLTYDSSYGWIRE